MSNIWEKWPRLFPPWSKDDPTTFDSLRRALMNWKVENTPIIDEAMEKVQKYDAHEWITKETEEGEIQDIYHIDELATAVEDKRKAEGKLEVIAVKVGEWDKVHYRDKHAAPSILEDLEKILEAKS